MSAPKTTTTSESKPPKWATPLFEQSASEASKLYNSGSGGNVYQGDTVAGIGGTTQAGINGVQNVANSYNSGAGQSLLNASQGQISQLQNYLSNPTASQTNLGGIAAGSGAPSAAKTNLSGLASGATGPSSAQNYLTNYANGSYLKSGGNPYFNEALQGQLDNTASQVQSQFSGAGRYGSGANTNALTTQLGNIRSGALANQFNQDTQNQFNAVSQLDAQRQLGAQNQMAASGQIDAQTQQGLQNQMAASGQIDSVNSALNGQRAGLIGSQQNQLTALNNWNQGALGANQALTSSGQLQDANAQDQLTAALNKFQATDMQDWTRLGLLQSAASGSAGNYGTNIQQTKSSFNPLSAIGGIGSLAMK